eukprot:SAG31_NODE_141_length_22675_cov_48.948879_24_plen_114_part_00
MDSGQRGGQWAARWTVGSAADSGQRGGQWAARRTVGSAADSGQRGGQWAARWTVGSAVDSGQRGGQWAARDGALYNFRGTPRHQFFSLAPEIADAIRHKIEVEFQDDIASLRV